MSSPSPAPSVALAPDLPTVLWFPLLVTVIGGLIVAAVITVTVRAMHRHPLRWARVTTAKFWRWVRGLGIATTRKRAALFDAGYAKKAKEIEAERAAASRPVLRVEKDRHFGDDRIFWLINEGFACWEAELVADSDSFTFEGSRFLPGQIGSDVPGGYTGTQFRGVPTARGRDEGVVFDVTWSDRSGNRQAGIAFLPPDKTPPESSGNAYLRGRADVEAEHEAKRARPVRTPRWLVGPNPAGNSEPNRNVTWALGNTTTGAVTTDVAVDAPADEVLLIGVTDFEAVEGGGPHVVFAGIPTRRGLDYGIHFNIEWNDANGDRRQSTFHWSPPDHVRPY